MNIELISFYIALLGVFLSWQWMFKPTMLDATRDALFDLRESTREYFTGTANGLESEAYRELRQIINGHIRYAEDLTFVSFIFACITMSRHVEYIEKHKAKVDRCFDQEAPAVRDYALHVRKEAIEIMSRYIVKTSLLALSLTLLINLYLMLRVLANGFKQFKRPAIFAGLIALVGLNNAALAQDTLETSALHASSVD